MSQELPHLANLRAAEKRTLLAKLLREKTEQRGPPFPLAHGQRALWFLQQLDPDNVAYNEAFAWRLRLAVDEPALRAVFQGLSERHPALRTTYALRNGEPLQQVQSCQPADLEIVDARGWTFENLTDRLAEETRKPFDLECGPMFRARLFTLAPRDHVLLTTFHHIAMDLTSAQLFVRDIEPLYFAARAGQEARLPPLSAQYRDFVSWQAKLLTSSEGERHWAYWQQQLAGELPVLHLPTDRPRPPLRTFQGAAHHFQLSEQLSRQLNALAQSKQTTLFALLLAAFQVLLHRYTGQEDILVGTVAHGRSRPEFEGVVGFFANPIVLRTHLSGNPTFTAFVKQVQQTLLKALEHQDLPFSLLVERLAPQRDLSRALLFDVAFLMRHARRSNAENRGQQGPEKLGVAPVARANGATGGVAVLEPLPLEQSTAKTDLELEVFEVGPALAGWLRYNTDLFDAATIAHMQGHFETLLHGLVADPEQRLSELPLLTAGERNRILVEWNATEADYPAERCIHQLLEDWAEQTPEAVAACFEDEELTYGELNCRANQLARLLRKQGVGPGALVGLCLEPSLEMLIALWGILKAGGAFVPLDPGLPRSRLAFMLADTQLPVLLTRQSLTTDLPAHEAHVVCLDAEEQAIAQESRSNPDTLVAADDLAYVIFTSGSTGQPKGVCLGHRGLCNLVEAFKRHLQLPPGSRVLQAASWGFDGAIGELAMALGAGASLCLGTRESLQPGTPLLQTLCRRRINLACLPPSVWSAMAVEELPDLQMILAVGESCPADVVARWAPGRRFLNGYGPTEATVATTLFDCAANDNDNPAIGRPIINTQVYLLDCYLKPVPVGMPGEMYIGGVGLAHGYLNRPELTAEKFIANPFRAEPGARLYRTGDRARYRTDGTLEFLGRIDQQVKIRGFRIELGEVEAVLSQHPEVRDAVVVAREDAAGDRRLAAFVVPKTGISLSQDELRAHLRAELPDPMVPATFTMLEALPLLPSGKIDRGRLPVPGPQISVRKSVFVAPRTSTEEELARIWANVLEVDRVGIHDDFFALGGHSLSTIQVMSRARVAFGVEMPLRAFFIDATVAGLAAAIDLARQESSSAASPAQQIDLNAEAMLDSSIRYDKVCRDPSAEPDCIFLTGASGFLGAFLLHELLQQTRAEIYCLVRAPDAGEGEIKLRRNLEAYGLWNEALRSRVIPVPGDLSAPLLGLNASQFQMLAGKIDVIYHNGALVNLLYPYEALKAANVLGTQEVLRLAGQIKLKPVHYVSTGSVFPLVAPGEDKTVHENDDLEDSARLAGGYAQSKWVAEKMVLAARARGLPLAVYRPGQITGHATTGMTHLQDFLCRLMIGCSRIGSVPDLDLMIDMTPVDFVSQALAHLAASKESLGKVFHLVNPQPASLHQLADWLQKLGYQLRRVPYGSWRAEIQQLGGSELEKAFHALIPQSDSRSGGGPDEAAPPNRRMPRFDCQNTLAALAETSIRCPGVNSALLNTYLMHFVRNGLLAAPPSRRA